MKQTLLYLLISIATLCLSNAQQLDNLIVSKSNLFQDAKKKSTLAFAEKDSSGGLVTVRSYAGNLLGITQGYYIDYFDATLQLQDSFVLEMKLGSKTPGIIRGLIVVEDTIYLICERFKKEEGQTILTYSVFSSQRDRLDFKEREIYTFKRASMAGLLYTDPVIRSNFSQRNLGPIGQVGFSENKNFMAIHQTIKTGENSQAMMVIFDRNFNLLYERDMSTFVNENVYQYQDFSIDDTDGSIYYLVKSFEGQEGKKRVSLQKDYHYQIIKVSKDKEGKAIDLKVDNTFIRSLVTINKHGKLSCVGFYSDKNDRRTKGVARYNIDPVNFELLEKIRLPFSEQFLRDKYGRLKEKELRFTEFKNVFMSTNGDIVINGEEDFLGYKTINGFSEIQNYYKYDIVTAKISEDGNLIWARNINKAQRTDGSQLDYISYTSTVANGSAYFVINGGEILRELTKNRISFPKVTKNLTNLYVIVINPDGTMDYEKKIDNKDSKLAYKTATGIISLDESEIILEGARKKNKGLVGISF